MPRSSRSLTVVSLMVGGPPIELDKQYYTQRFQFREQDAKMLERVTRVCDDSTTRHIGLSVFFFAKMSTVYEIVIVT